MVEVVSRYTQDRNTKLILLGTYGLTESFINLIEKCSFFLAVKMKLPITHAEKATVSSF
jgi:hypothetical protein